MKPSKSLYEKKNLLGISSNNSKVHLYKHIKDDDPKNNRVLTFEIVNNLNFDKGDAFNIPSINQWLKCSIHSIYRNIANSIRIHTIHQW